MTVHQRLVLTLRSGREVLLAAFDRAPTYASLGEGYPTRKMNDHIIEHAMQDAEGRCWTCTKGGAKPLLLPPDRAPVPHEPDRLPTADEVEGFLREVQDWIERFGVPEFLPPWKCVGTFKSAPKHGAPDKPSWLTVIWFQPKHRHVHEAVLGQLQQIDWESLAVSIEL
ncbi:hypothetical protein [Polyangium jinanense]|uniref:Uncharacterized protein n=1 Tax=Polyangium jinanense TaxID=2829994 RepID=A0A9X4AVE6_9BACT|nr:hypothetical protein [Polyangium jinanense]MDC3956606.1 hypothetical protein [Polyangium jinanense]MDC3985611.1 hypothetical protein [Polyangium jinanense]